MLLRKKCLKNYLKETTQKGIVTNSSFWNFIKPFLTNKSSHTQNNIILVENRNAITKESELVNIFNDHYVNIVEKSSGNKPIALSNSVIVQDSTIDKILQYHNTHPSIANIRVNIDSAKIKLCVKNQNN